MSALRRRESVRPVALEAIVSNPDPDGLTVTIDDFDGDQLTRHAWPAVSWPSSETAMPARGDRCLVVMSEIGRAWVVAGAWTGNALHWTRLDLKTDWSAESPGPAPGCAKSATGWVTLRGVLVKGSAATRDEELLVKALPEDCRPSSRRSFVASVGASGGSAARVHVRTDGQLAIGEILSPSSTGVLVMLDGIGFYAED